MEYNNGTLKGVGTLGVDNKINRKDINKNQARNNIYDQKMSIIKKHNKIQLASDKT